ncbi:VIT family protein [Gordonia sp. (in: high G+C Gram-positive bacteria)]|uniref:VIT1/CCC1 transporter family protein n=1 Tax=Gordonia sp. (in: high G+C Gram-positive bacteria) TaxID=84139 RepID=UPI0039E5A128
MSSPLHGERHGRGDATSRPHLGADDGIVSTAGIVVGVAAVSAEHGPLFTAGIAALTSGAVSMALGEYVSVSTRRDTEAALIAKERRELRDDPAAELVELAGLYEDKGLAPETAAQVAKELTAADALAAHVEVESNLDPDELSSPWQAAASSAIAFTLGALLPLIAVLLPPEQWRIPVVAVAVLIALAVTGAAGAVLGGARPLRPAIRTVLGGAIAMGATYGIGTPVGHAVG